jgi:hypothetical protein
VSSSRFQRSRTPAPDSADGMRSLTRMRVDPAPGSATERYLEVRAILLRYLSSILVDSVLDRALAARNLTPAMLSPTALGEVAADILVGLRLFVREDRLPELMVELAAILDLE